MVFDELIQVADAEAALREGRARTPESIRAAVEAATGDQLAAQVAEARARLMRAAQEKGF